MNLSFPTFLLFSFLIPTYSEHGRLPGLLVLACSRVGLLLSLFVRLPSCAFRLPSGAASFGSLARAGCLLAASLPALVAARLPLPPPTVPVRRVPVPLDLEARRDPPGGGVACTVAAAAVKVAVWKLWFVVVLPFAVVLSAADLLFVGAAVVSRPILVLLQRPTPWTSMTTTPTTLTS